MTNGPRATIESPGRWVVLLNTANPTLFAIDQSPETVSRDLLITGVGSHRIAQQGYVAQFDNPIGAS
jgi:hypothetical protein